MAKTSFGSVTVKCPVCGQDLTVGLEARKVIHTSVDPTDPDSVAKMTGRLHVVLPDFDDPSTYPVGHDECFTVTDEDRAAIAELEDI